MKNLLFIITANLIIYSGLQAQDFTLKSNELGGQLPQKQFYNGMGYNGLNLSPQLSWKGEPEGTRYYAVTMYDPDAPTGSGFWHWVVFNIPADCHELSSGAGNSTGRMLPSGTIQSRTDFGTIGYSGAAPGDGPAHRYIITVYALRDKLDLTENATPALVGFYLQNTALAKASLIVYGKKDNGSK